MKRKIYKEVSSKYNMKNKNKGIKLRCPGKRCNHYIWDYKGDQKLYACCPKCHNSVNIEKHRIDKNVKRENTNERRFKVE